MKKEDTYYLGKIVKKYGLKGELLAKIDTDDPGFYENMESIFLEIRGRLVPFFLDKCTLHKPTTLRLRFEDVDTLEDADMLVNKKIYLPLNSLPELTGNKFYYHEIIDFDAVDQRLGNIGKIVAVNNQAAQAFFVIEDAQKNEILIPVSDRFIKKVDRVNKAVIFDTPEGLIEVYR